MDDIIKHIGAPKSYKDDRGGAVLFPHPIIGIVKNNIDPLRSGKIEVYLKRLNDYDEDNPLNWTPVRYLSPFFGNTPNTGTPNGDGTYLGNSNSYGFWATPPDIGTEVICVFINGQPDLGYYIGSIPQATMNHMVPAIGSAKNVIPNAGEAEGYGGSTTLPVSEYNDANKKQSNSATPYKEPRPVHSYQAAILNKQGLIRDGDRGAITSSAQRESPSNVFGMSTPGRPIYQGGFSAPGNIPITDAVENSDLPDEQFKVIGRLGGHTFVMDDGDLGGKDQLFRLRSGTGHTILMNDYAQTLFIIHANGQSWIELGKEGTIDMYATNSVNVRTQGDLNLHADNNININAKKDLNISADNINIESLQATNQFVGTKYKAFTKGDHTLKVNGKMSFYSKGDSSVKSDGTNYLNGGPNVHLNTGASALVPEEVKQIPIIAHTDTLYDDKKGYAPAPGYLPSIVSRAPAHQPWANANKGVDVKINSSASTNFPSEPSSNLVAMNASLVGVPTPVTNAALAATVPNLNPVGNPLDKITTSTLVSQMAVNAAYGAGGNAVGTNGGIITTDDGQKLAVIGSFSLTPNQLEKAGVLKPGSAVAVNAAITNGKSLEEAMPPNVFTGKYGIVSLDSLMSNTSAQSTISADLIGTSEIELKNAGVITGKESSSQIGGLILAGATAGVAAAVAFAKSGVTSLTNAIGSVPADIKALVSGGNTAASLGDKIKTGITGVTDKLKGLAAGAFESITKTFKSLVPNKPQNLDEAKAASLEENPDEAANAEKLASGNSSTGTLDKIKNAVSNVTLGQLTGAIGGIAALTGRKEIGAALSGISAVSELASKNPNGLSGIVTNVKNSITSLFKGSAGVKEQVTDVANKIKESGGSLNSLANTGLSATAAAELESSITSAGTPGSVDVKTPIVASNTFDDAAITGQTAELLGSDKIPTLPTNTPSATRSNRTIYRDPTTGQEVSPTTSSNSSDKERQIDAAQEIVNQRREEYRQAKANYEAGTGSIATEKATYAKYESAVKAIDALKAKLYPPGTSPFD